MQSENVVPVMQSVLNETLLDKTIKNYHPQIFIHAAAYKHVPLVEENQEEAIQALLENNDVLFLAKTGLGKTLTFQLPSLMKEGTAIVVSPLLSLMEDQINNTEKIGINSKTLNSTLDKKCIW
jgi:superfamily II DNA helicase RecQ